MDINIVYTDLLEVVKRSLSIIGKRSTDDNGNRLFSDITVGTNEESIINDYLQQAVIDIAAELSTFITYTGGTATMNVPMQNNQDAAVEPFIQQAADAYCVSYALYSWFDITAPRLVEKYANDCKRQLNAIVRLVNDKRPPKASTDSYLDIDTDVTDN